MARQRRESEMSNFRFKTRLYEPVFPLISLVGMIGLCKERPGSEVNPDDSILKTDVLKNV